MFRELKIPFLSGVMRETRVAPQLVRLMCRLPLCNSKKPTDFFPLMGFLPRVTSKPWHLQRLRKRTAKHNIDKLQEPFFAMTTGQIDNAEYRWTMEDLYIEFHVVLSLND